MAEADRMGIKIKDFADEIVEQVTTGMAKGCEDAYRRFFKSYFDRIYKKMLVRSRGDEHLARDLSQMVLLKVVRYIQPMDSEARLMGWLNQLIRSVHVDWLRRNGGRNEIRDSWIREALPAEGEDEEDELFYLLQSSVEKLGAEETELLQLSYFEGLPQKAIAARLKTSTKAVESKLARIRSKLRNTILERLKQHALI
jgi:RNA polymerase sigma-70 factor, ECF subfamily